MSQFYVGTNAGSLPPSVPLQFTTDDGDTAIPAGNNLNVFSEVIDAGTNTPIQTIAPAPGNTVMVQVQLASKASPLLADPTSYAGIASFDDNQFDVDEFGFVSLVGSEIEAAIKAINVDTSLPPGEDPVFSDTDGILTITGDQIAANSTANVIRTDSLADNSFTIQIQRSSKSGVSNVALNGVCHFDSSDFDVNSNGYVQLSGAGAGETLTGNSGGALSPTLNNWNIITTDSTVKFAGAVSTLTLDFGLPNLLLGTSAPGISGGASNNVGIGDHTLELTTTASSNTIVGANAALGITTSSGNTGIGLNVLGTLSTGSGQNTAIGNGSLINLATGTRNTALGVSAGTAYIGAESNNIIIGHTGVAAESNIIRIGTQGSGAGQQTDVYLAGVLNTTSGRTVNITTPGAYPYTTLTTDYVILVDTSSARTITPLASPATGTTYRIKDNVGSAAANIITITPSGKNIDGSASFVISTNYGSADIVYNGTQWNVL